MLCIGHRGAMGHEPENTLLSIKKALELGVDGIEIDVHNVEDNLVVIHDRDLSRTTNGTGYLEQHSFEYLRSLDAGKREQIPTLPQVFDTVNRQVVINIELKGSNTAELVAKLIREYIAKGWSESDFVVSSFDHYQLNQFKNNCPSIKIGMLIYGLPWHFLTIATELKADIVIFGLDYINAHLVQATHQQNLQTWVYTVNQPEDISLMAAIKVDAIFSNYPERVISSF